MNNQTEMKDKSRKAKDIAIQKLIFGQHLYIGIKSSRTRIKQ